MSTNRRIFIEKACLAGACFCKFTSIVKAGSQTLNDDNAPDPNKLLMQVWISTLLLNIDDQEDEPICRKIMKGCASSHYNHLKMDDFLKPYEENLEKFNSFIEQEWGWKIDYQKDTWDYMVKVKLKNLGKLLQSQTWVSIKGDKDVAICEFTYKAKGWSKLRVLKAMRSVKEYVQVEYLGEKQIIPGYQYVCYASNYDMDAVRLHELYKQRSTSETWIEQIKGHTMAGTTLTDNFWANDILWQLNILAYNLSVMMRQKKSKFKKQEHRTFIDWVIAVPTKITISGHQIELKMYEHHFYKVDWEELDRLIEAA